MTVVIRRGGIYWIPDSAANFPPVALKDRKLHKQRPFLVISDDQSNVDPNWPVVVGFPLSTSDEFRGRFDVALKAGTANLPEDSWVRINMLQPMAKEKLRERVGGLDANNVELCLERLIQHIG